MNEFNENEKRIMARLRELWRKEEENNSNYSDFLEKDRLLIELRTENERALFEADPYKFLESHKSYLSERHRDVESRSYEAEVLRARIGSASCDWQIGRILDNIKSKEKVLSRIISASYPIY